MEKPSELAKELFQQAEALARTNVELYKLKAIDKSTEVASSLTSGVTLILVLSMFVLIFNVGIALWLGEMLGRAYYGFFIVAGFYLFAAVILYIFRTKLLKNPVRNSIIRQILN